MDFEEAVQDKRWRDAMDEEVKSIEKNDSWELVSLLKGHKAIGVKWEYKTKKNAKGEIERYKAGLVAKGYNQKAGINYDEMFAPIARLEASCKWSLPSWMEFSRKKCISSNHWDTRWKKKEKTKFSS